MEVQTRVERLGKMGAFGLGQRERIGAAHPGDGAAAGKAVGYEDYATFERAFRRLATLTPRAFAQKHRSGG